MTYVVAICEANAMEDLPISRAACHRFTLYSDNKHVYGTMANMLVFTTYLEVILSVQPSLWIVEMPISFMFKKISAYHAQLSITLQMTSYYFSLLFSTFNLTSQLHRRVLGSNFRAR